MRRLQRIVGLAIALGCAAPAGAVDVLVTVSGQGSEVAVDGTLGVFPVESGDERFEIVAPDVQILSPYVGGATSFLGNLGGLAIQFTSQMSGTLADDPPDDSIALARFQIGSLVGPLATGVRVDLREDGTADVDLVVAGIEGDDSFPLALQFSPVLAPNGPCVTPGGSGGCFATIGAALGAATGSDTIRVAAGTYVENVAIGENVTLEGGWNADFTLRNASVNETVIEPADPTFSVVSIEGSFVDPAASTPVLDGFTIRGGRADEGGNHGGGVRIRDSNATLRNCHVRDNRAFLFGGGVWVQRGAPRIEGNRIESNVVVGDGALGGGLQLETDQVVELIDNAFVGNSIEGTGGQGGGVQVFATVRVRGGRFESNRAGSTCATGTGGAIQALQHDIRGVTFRDNCAATFGTLASPYGEIYGSLFVDGPTALATPVWLRLVSSSGGPVVQNSTFVWTGPTPITGIEIADDEANAADRFQFDNNLFLGVEILQTDVAKAVGERNVFSNGALPPNPSLGTLDVSDPMLDADYRLRPGSPLVDAGVAGNSFRDVDGDPRPADAGSGRFAFDVGADELAGRAQRVVDLAHDAADLTVVGPGNPPENPDSVGTNDWIGRAVLAEDVSGDGLDDLVVSAQDFANDFDTDNAGGRLFGLLHFGDRPTGVRELASEPADFEVACAIPLQHQGEELASGDLDGDGAQDLVIGASDTHGSPGVVPAAFTLFGGASLADGATIAPGSFADFTVLAPDATSLAFAAVNGIATGDLSGDGVDDLAVGDASFENVFGELGAVHLFFGGASREGTLVLPVTPADVTLGWPYAGGTFAAGPYAGGIAIGDVDADGQADLVVRDAGYAYLLFGPIAPGRDTLDPGYTVIAPLEAGGVVVMDFDGDGVDDVLLDSAGTIFVLTGPLPRSTILGPLYAESILVHDTTFAAQALASADVAGDPRPDLLVGKPDRRVVFVVDSGREALGEVAIEDVAAWIVRSSNVDVRNLGFDVAGGDLDGDARDDLVVGSWAIEDPARTQGFRDVGQAFVFYGEACADGRVAAGEPCDDAGVASGDGCSSWCTIEIDHACVGEPSACGLDVARLAPGAVAGSSVAVLGGLAGVAASLTSSLDLTHDGLALSFWLSLDASFDPADREVGSCALPPLAAGASQACNGGFVVPNDLPLIGGASTAYRWLACVENAAGRRCAASAAPVLVPEPSAFVGALVACAALGSAARVPSRRRDRGRALA